MTTVRAHSNIEHYQHLFPTYIRDNFNNFEKLFWVLGQGIGSANYTLQLSLDSYGILPKQTTFVDKISKFPSIFNESSYRENLLKLRESFLPTSNATNPNELALEWSKLLAEAITPVGLRDFLTFLTAVYIVDSNLDMITNNTCKNMTKLMRINAMKKYIQVYIDEWSSNSQEVVQDLYTITDDLNFMEIRVLVGVHPILFPHINQMLLAKYLYNQIQNSKDKLTPTIQILSIDVVGAWDND